MNRGVENVQQTAKIRFGELTPPRKGLVLLMNRLRFGWIEHLEVRNGAPQYGPKTRIFRDCMFDSRRSTTVIPSDTCELKEQVCELLLTLDRIGNGSIEVLKFQDGLPFRAHVEEGMHGQLGD